MSFKSLASRVLGAAARTLATATNAVEQAVAAMRSDEIPETAADLPVSAPAAVPETIPVIVAAPVVAPVKVESPPVPRFCTNRRMKQGQGRQFAMKVCGSPAAPGSATGYCAECEESIAKIRATAAKPHVTPPAPVAKPVVLAPVKAAAKSAVALKPGQKICLSPDCGRTHENKGPTCSLQCFNDWQFTLPEDRRSHKALPNMRKCDTCKHVYNQQSPSHLDCRGCYQKAMAADKASKSSAAQLATEQVRKAAEIGQRRAEKPAPLETQTKVIIVAPETSTRPQRAYSEAELKVELVKSYRAGTLKIDFPSAMVEANGTTVIVYAKRRYSVPPLETTPAAPPAEAAPVVTSTN